jgi:hypothetical protein
MRRLTLQFNLDELIARAGEQESLKELESFEILHILKQDASEMTMIAKLALRDKKTKIEDLFGDELAEYQLLETDKNGAGTYFLKTRPQRHPDNLDSVLGLGGYFTEPFFIRDGKATMTFLGSSSEVKSMLKMIESMKVPYKIAALGDAKFSFDSPLNSLTEKQRRVIVSAFNSGYYEVPRRTSSEELAEGLKIRAPTLVMHRRRAEQRVLKKVING